MAAVDMDVSDQIIAFKRRLAPNREGLKRAYADVKGHVSRAADSIRRDVAGGRAVVPELDYQDIRDGNVHETVRQSIRSTGC
ncbi:MAG TPA: YbiU family protein, partial [Vicinamibacterales bacterium]|nr:YbiU family protein [Vicinamibacterales bacterium]